MDASFRPRPAPTTWDSHRERVQGHFTEGAERWTRLTGNGPVSRIRATVRAGRLEMRNILHAWLPEDLSGARVLDAGCGPGVFSLELARRGARVVGVDLAGELIDEARRRAAAEPLPEGAPVPEFRTGDFLDVVEEGFDLVVAMDCFIHYPLPETLQALRTMKRHVGGAVLLTVAPWTPLLAAMHAVGRVFPHGNRAPGIVPVRERALKQGLAGPHGPGELRLGRTAVVHKGFYISRAVELLPCRVHPAPQARS